MGDTGETCVPGVCLEHSGLVSEVRHMRGEVGEVKKMLGDFRKETGKALKAHQEEMAEVLKAYQKATGMALVLRWLLPLLAAIIAGGGAAAVVGGQ